MIILIAKGEEEMKLKMSKKTSKNIMCALKQQSKQEGEREKPEQGIDYVSDRFHGHPWSKGRFGPRGHPPPMGARQTVPDAGRSGPGCDAQPPLRECRTPRQVPPNAGPPPRPRVRR